jgi:hypothetical protein
MYRRNAEDKIRQFERAAQEGDGQAYVAWLSALSRSGKLPTRSVDATMAFSGGKMNEWVGGDNAWEFVDSGLIGARKMIKKGGTPYLLVTEYGDVKIPSTFGTDLRADAEWLRNTYDWTANRALEGEVSLRLRRIYMDALRILELGSVSDSVINESLSYLHDYPEILINQGVGPEVTPRQYAMAALQWHIEVQEGILDDLKRAGP